MMIADNLNRGAMERRVENMRVRGTDDSERMPNSLFFKKTNYQIADFGFHLIQMQLRACSSETVVGPVSSMVLGGGTRGNQTQTHSHSTGRRFNVGESTAAGVRKSSTSPEPLDPLATEDGEGRTPMKIRLRMIFNGRNPFA